MPHNEHHTDRVSERDFDSGLIVTGCIVLGFLIVIYSIVTGGGG